ncbi:MAG TPA: nucleotidyltransferase family protein, partial [Acidobacteriaceae bacterium]
MRLPLSNSISFRATDELRAREAALLLVCDARYGDCASLDNLSSSQWSRLLHWLDTSGLALYFLDRVIELQQSAMLPSEVLASLHQRLADNIARTASMVAESAELHREFQLANLCYATLKGFSLFPHSVPKPELRSQLDLDFLVAEESAPRARRILEDRGYYLHATSGRSWEFKTLEKPGISLERVYQ